MNAVPKRPLSAGSGRTRFSSPRRFKRASIGASYFNDGPGLMGGEAPVDVPTRKLTPDPWTRLEQFELTDDLTKALAAVGRDEPSKPDAASTSSKLANRRVRERNTTVIQRSQSAHGDRDDTALAPSSGSRFWSPPDISPRLSFTLSTSFGASRKDSVEVKKKMEKAKRVKADRARLAKQRQEEKSKKKAQGPEALGSSRSFMTLSWRSRGDTKKKAEEAEVKEADKRLSASLEKNMQMGSAVSERRLPRISSSRGGTPTAAGTASIFSRPSSVRLERVRLDSLEDCGYQFFGLHNLGNTCFMNAALQCLVHIEPFRQAFVERLVALGPEDHQEEATLVNALDALMGSIITSNASPGASPSANTTDAGRGTLANDVKAFSPIALRSVMSARAPQFQGFAQHDSQEFIRFLLDGLSEDLAEPASPGGSDAVEKEEEHAKAGGDEDPRRSVIDDIFCGELESRVHCLSCGHVSRSCDPFLDISLPLVHSDEDGAITLDNCLRSFFQTEELDEGEQVECEGCGARTRQRRQILPRRLPRVLLVHLKRFYFDGETKGKIDACVEIPENVDLQALLGEEEDGSGSFVLRSAINHVGGLSHGHYTAHLRGVDNAWYCADDARVAGCDGIDEESAYVLFFGRTEDLHRA